MDNFILGYRNTISVQSNQNYTLYYTLRSPYTYTCVVKNIRNTILYSSSVKKETLNNIKYSETIQFNTGNTIIVYIEFHIPKDINLLIHESCLIPMSNKHIAILYGKSISKRDRWLHWLIQKIKTYIKQDYKVSLFITQPYDINVVERDLYDLNNITYYFVPEKYILDSIQSNDRITPYDKIICIGNNCVNLCAGNQYILRYKTEVYLLSDIGEYHYLLEYSDQFMKIICHQKKTYDRLTIGNTNPMNIIKNTYIPHFLYQPLDTKKKQNQFIYVGSLNESKSSLDMLQTILTYIKKTSKNVYFLIYYNDIVGDDKYVEKINDIIQSKHSSLSFVKNANQETIQKSMSESTYGIYNHNTHSRHLSFVLIEYEYYGLEIICDLERLNVY